MSGMEIVLACLLVVQIGILGFVSFVYGRTVGRKDVYKAMEKRFETK